MNRLFLVSAIAACSTTPPSTPATHLAHRLVVISVDGLMPDVYLDPDAHGMKVPTLRALVAGGAAGRVHGVMPTVTYPSHTTMVTGVSPKVHGIVSNKPADPLGKNYDGWRWYAEDIKAPTIYQAVEAAHGTAALVTWPVSVAAHASIVVPEYWRAGGVDDQKLVRALSTPGVLDEVQKRDPDLWKALTPPDIKDASQFAIASYLLDVRKPDLLLVHAFELDDAQHEHAPWSPEAKAVIENVDAKLGALLKQLQASPDWSRTILVIVSDHGFAPVDHELRPGVAFEAHKIAPTDAWTIASGGSDLIYCDAAHRPAVEAALVDLKDHIARVIDHDELVRLGGDPQAAFALVAAPTYQFSDKRTGDLVVDVPGRGTHGWPPDDPAMAASFIAFGPDVPHIALGPIDTLDFAPTFARWLGVPLATEHAALPIAR
ncbi:MAG: ectonucleotide pyrophosphatase/phosphodiesterase [Kofleriaceae bacterium]